MSKKKNDIITVVSPALTMITVSALFDKMTDWQHGGHEPVDEITVEWRGNNWKISKV